MTAPATRQRIAPRWRVSAAPDPSAVAALCETLRLPEIVCRLLVARGYGDLDAARTYLRPRLEQLHDPIAMLGMREAVDRIARAIRNGETILVHGDYDVDGITSTTMMRRCASAVV